MTLANIDEEVDVPEQNFSDFEPDDDKSEDDDTSIAGSEDSYDRERKKENVADMLTKAVMCSRLGKKKKE